MDNSYLEDSFCEDQANVDEEFCSEEKDYLDVVIKSENDDDNSETGSFAKQLSYLPKTFSNVALSVLNSEPTSPHELSRGRNQLVREIITHLNNEGLIQSSSSSNRREYQLLGDQLIRVYNKFQWLDGKNSREKSHICQGLLSCISGRRRTARTRNKQFSSLKLSPKDALERSKLSYLPKTFSDVALSVLNSEPMSPFALRRRRKQLVREIITHLDDEGLIQGSGLYSNRREYQLLGDQLTRVYSKFRWLDGKNLGKNSHVCQGLLTCISGRRRTARFKRNRPFSSPELSRKEALAKLKTIDVFKKNRGRCLHEDCSTTQTECPEITVTNDVQITCAYCEHDARFHFLLSNTDSVSELVQEKREGSKCRNQGLTVASDCDSNINIKVINKKISKRARMGRPMEELNLQQIDEMNKPSSLSHNSNELNPSMPHTPGLSINMETMSEFEKRNQGETELEHLFLQNIKIENQNIEDEELFLEMVKIKAEEDIKEEVNGEEETLANPFVLQGIQIEEQTIKHDKVKNEDVGPLLDIMDKNSTINFSSKELSYLPKSFSDIALAVLNYEPMSPHELIRGRNQLVREIHNHLDDEELILSSSSSNRREYQLLGDQLVRAYSKFQWLDGKNSREKSHICQGLLSCISGRRRTARFNRNKPFSSPELSPKEASARPKGEKDIRKKTKLGHYVLRDIKIKNQNIEDEELFIGMEAEEDLKKETLAKSFVLQGIQIKEQAIEHDIVKNKDVVPLVNIMDKNPKIKSSSKKLSYLPKSFSDIALAVLNSEPMSPHELSRGRNQLVREIHNHLDDEELILSSSSSNRRDYQLLGDQLIRGYSKFQWLDGKNSREKSHICQGLLSCISGRRRTARFNRNKPFSNPELSPKEVSARPKGEKDIRETTKLGHYVLQDIKIKNQNIEDEELFIGMEAKEDLKKETLVKPFVLQGIQIKEQTIEQDKVKNKDVGALVDIMDKNPKIKSSSKKLSYLPNSFSDIALAVLNSEPMSQVKLILGRNQLVREIHNHLDDKGLIQSSSSSNKREYQLLGHQLIRVYSKFQWLDEKNFRKKSHICQGLLTCLSGRRRAARYYKNKPFSSLELSPPKG